MAAGGFRGFMHLPIAYLTDGRSLHPSQREGMVPHSGFSVIPAQAPPSLGGAPPARASDLALPSTLYTGVGAMAGARFHV